MTMRVLNETVDINTIQGLTRAEELHERGWTTGSVGLFKLQFYLHVSDTPENHNLPTVKYSCQCPQCMANNPASR